ncbi:MAG TPA: GNAT family N-acetyltransferase [Acidimicrobiia bacterium]|nr:GNAT family N-acetyltransferase [Acidimicrobiia bacterium]
MIDVRAVAADELEALLHAASGPFGFDFPPDPSHRQAFVDRMAATFEPDRARCAFDGDRMVGTLATHSFDMSVPGGSIPVAGTTLVTVQVTHRRQGILSSLIEHHLEEARERGDYAAALWASDSAIYGRFGYGMAAWSTELQIDRHRVDRHRLAPQPADVEIVDADGVRPSAMAVYDLLRRDVPGMVGHSEGWWDRILVDVPWRSGRASRFAVAVEDGNPTGWVKYRIDDADEDDGHPAQDVIVSQLYAVTPAAWTGIWFHVLSHDFGRMIKAELRPVDDPIHSLMAGMRRVRTRRTDGLWVRVLDVGRALEGRTYRTGGMVTLTISDRLGHASGSYRLEADGGEAAVETVDSGTVVMDVEDLGALLLGGRSAVALAAAGRIAGPSRDVELLDAMFRGGRAPWSPVIF